MLVLRVPRCCIGENGRFAELQLEDIPAAELCWGPPRWHRPRQTQGEAVFPGGRRCQVPPRPSLGSGVFPTELVPVTVLSPLCSAKDVKHRLGSLLQKSHSCEHHPAHSKKDKAVVCPR